MKDYQKTIFLIRLLFNELEDKLDELEEKTKEQKGIIKTRKGEGKCLIKRKIPLN